MTTEIEKAVNAALKEELEAIRFNLSSVWGGLLYSLKLEMEKGGYVGVIEEVISHVIRTSKQDGPEGEEYPTYDAEGCEDLMQVIVEALQPHGIKQSGYISSKVLKETD